MIPADESDAGTESTGRARSFRIGVALAIVNTIIGAGQPVITRYGAVHLDPLLFCTGAVVVATLCAIPLLYHSGDLGQLFDARYRAHLFLMSISGSVLTSLTLTYGLNRIGAVAGVLLMQTEPIYSLLLAIIFMGERPPLRQIIATVVILLGIGSVFWGGGAFSPMWAAALIFVTPLFWQIGHVIGLKIMPPLTPISVTAGRFFYGSFVLTTMLLVIHPGSIAQLADLRMLGIVVITGVFVYFLSALTWYGAINRLSLAWTTALVIPGIPILSIIFSVLLLGERATVREVVGILISVSGVLALVLGSDPHRKLPASEAAEAFHEPLI
jgi:drug/metabolite transporter (DMT)-like permease